MTSDPRRQEIEELFEAALEVPAGERRGFVAIACPGDGVLQREVLALLDAHERAGGVLEVDAAGAAASLLERRTTAPADRIGRYRIVRELGRGGMGVVYLGERDDGVFRQRVAIKLIRSEVGGPGAEEMYRRFQVERQILASLDHPNIGRLLDGGLTEEGWPYLVMEHVEGVPIDAYCDRERLGVERRLRLFCEVAHAVHYAHRNLVVHRDLKPSNIFVTGDGVVKLLDFGIAKILDPTAVGQTGPLTRTGLRLMTPEYASPEQVRGGAITTATDVYGLGVVLYELLAGRRPFELEGKSGAEWERAILEEEPPRPSSVVGSVVNPRMAAEAATTAGAEEGGSGAFPLPVGEAFWTLPQLDRREHVWRARRARLRRRLRGDLDRIVLMALRKEPERRYASAEGLAEDIERHLQGLPVTAHRGSRRYRLAKLIRRHRVPAAAAALVAVSLVVGAAGALWQASIARRERDRTDEARVEAEQALARSEDVTGFLIGLFEAANPEQALADTVAARELLRRGIARAEQLSDQPAVQAQIFDAVGQVYEKLGQYDRSQELFERAIALRLGAGEAADADVAVILNHLGWVVRRKGDYRRAEALHLEALAIQERELGPEHPQVAETLMDLGFLYPYMARLEDTEAMYRRALAIRRATLGEDDPRVAESLIALAATRRRQGYIDETERYLREALELQRRIYGSEHETVAGTMIHLGDLLHDERGEDAEAEALYREALAIQTARLGDRHPKLVHGLNSLGGLLSARGDHAGAEALIRRSLAIHREVFGPSYPGVAGSLSDLASEVASQGRYAEAEALQRESYATWERAVGPDHPAISGAMVALAEVLIPQGKLAEAEDLYRQALARRKAAYGVHPLTAETARDLASLLARKGEFLEAESLMTEALEIMRSLYPDGHELVRTVQRAMGELYTAWGKPQQARRYFSLAGDVGGRGP